MPVLHQSIVVLLNQRFNPANFLGGEPIAARQAHGVEPKLGFGLIAINMEMGRLRAISGKKENPVRTDSKCRSWQPS